MPLKIALVLFVTMLAVGCHADSPIFTPAPGDYPCHRQDGSADPNAVSCRPFDGKHECCPETYHCSMSGCDSDATYSPDFISATKPVPRMPDGQP